MLETKNHDEIHRISVRKVESEEKMKTPSIKKNFIMNALLTISAFIFPLITFPYISRVLGPIGIGKISFATSIINYFSMFTQLGIPTYGIRACAKVRDNKTELTRTAHELMIINIITSILSYLVLGISLIAVPKLCDEKALFIIMSPTILLTSIGMEWLYKAIEEYTYITLRSLAFKLVALIVMFILVHTKEDYIVYGGISIFAGCASNILNFINAHKYISTKPVGKYNLKRHVKPVFQFFAIACATTIYTNLDILMLGFMKTDVDVGYYNVAVKMKVILSEIVTSLGAILLPRATHYIENKQFDDFKEISGKALEFVFICATPLMVYFILFSKEAILVISGSAFLGSIEPMIIIMPTLLLIGLSNLLGIQMLIPLGKQNIVLYATILGAIIDVIINFLLIPNMASFGATIGTLVAEFVVLIVMYMGIKEIVCSELKKVNYLAVVISVVIGTILTFWLKYIDINNWVKVCISGILFFSSYIVFLLIRKETIAVSIFDDLKLKLRTKK